MEDSVKEFIKLLEQYILAVVKDVQSSDVADTIYLNKCRDELISFMENR